MADMPYSPAEDSVLFSITPESPEDFLQNTFNYSVTGMAIISPEGLFLRVNKRFQQIIGYGEQELAGKSFRELTHPADLAESNRLIVMYRKPEFNPKPFEKRYIRKDGKIVWVRVHISNIRGEDGALRYIISQAQDITEEKRQKDFLRQVIDINPNFIFAKNREGRFTLVNQAVADAYGTTVEDLIGRRDSDFNENSNEVEHFISDDLEVMNSREEKIIPEEQITDAGGNIRYLQTVKRPLIGEDGKASQVLGVSTDITERKRAEEERHTLEAQILQSQKLESLGVLAGGVAHDFNNFLMAILGHTSLALQSLPPDDPAVRNLEQAKRSALRAADLTTQLLAYSGGGTFELRPVDVSALVRELGGLLGTIISRKANVTYDLAPYPCTVKADAGQLRQVFMNLLTNASDALGGNVGQIVVRSAIRYVSAEYFSDEAFQTDLPSGNYVCISVEDSGLGMEEAVRRKIFDPFFTTKFTGRGLGLAAVQGIVRSHEGGLSVRSEVGKGTTFEVFFPVSADIPEDRPFNPAPRETTGSGSILIVDDEESIRSVSREMLERCGFAVIEACNGQEALSIFRAQHDSIRLILLDLTMPQMSGTDALAEIRKLSPDIPILLSSGYSEPSEIVSDRHCSFIQKPYDPLALAARVRAMTEG